MYSLYAEGIIIHNIIIHCKYSDVFHLYMEYTIMRVYDECVYRRSRIYTPLGIGVSQPSGRWSKKKKN